MKPFLSEVAAGVEALSLWILRITIVLVTLGEYSDSSAGSALGSQHCLPKRRKTQVIHPRYSGCCHVIFAELKRPAWVEPAHAAAAGQGNFSGGGERSV